MSRRNRFRFRIAGFIVATGLMSIAVSWRAVLDWQPTAAPAARQRVRTELLLKEEKRKVYPYSVVPGGAKTAAEAKSAMSDPAIECHYAAFDLTKLKQETLTADLLGYMSYRVGDQIYWTTKLLRIRAGESIFTDGIHIARGRCLNRYSKTPMLPTRRQEPSEITFNTPVELPLPSLTLAKIPLPEPPKLPPPLEELTPEVPTLPPPSGSASRGGFWFPIIPFIPPIHRHHPPPVTPIGPPPPPPAGIVPEPDYLWLLAGAAAAIGLIRMRPKKRDQGSSRH